MLTTLKNICLFVILIDITVPNVVNYFYAYKYLHDENLEWRIAMYSISIALFFFSLYVLLIQIGRIAKGIKTIKLVLAAWMTFYLLINMVGVCRGYNLHSKGFMAMLFVTILFGLIHVFIRLWEEYFQS